MKIKEVSYDRTYQPQPYQALKIGLVAEVEVQTEAEAVEAVHRLAVLVTTAYSIISTKGAPKDKALEDAVVAALTAKGLIKASGDGKNTLD